MSKRIPELDVGTVGIGSLFETAEVDGTSSTGYNSTKVSASDIGNFIANVMKYSGLDNKTIIQAILDASGGGGGGDSVSWSQVVVSGTKIATITINNVPTDVYAPEGGGTANFVELTQAEYDALEQAGQLQEDVMYFITDGQAGGGVVIDDSTTSASKVWSSNKTNTEIQAVAADVATKQDDLIGGSLSNVDLNNYKTAGNYWVTQTNVSNKPTTNFGYLEVIQVSTSTCLQRFTCYGNDTLATRGVTYIRFFTNNQWYSWNKIASATPENITVTRTSLTQNAGISKWGFSVPVVSGWTRMIIGANSSNSLAQYVRFEENGNNLDVFINNIGNSSVTYDMTIAVAYIRS